MVSGKLNNHMWKHETEPLSYTTHKNQVKMIKALNIRPGTIKFLEENSKDTLLDIGLDNNLSLTPEEQAKQSLEADKA